MTERTFQPNGCQYITNTIQAAQANGHHSAVITGNWEIDTAIRIPGDFTLILEGCHLRMAEGCYSNMFVNYHHDTDLGRTTAGTDRNISIIGKNGPVLDGGIYNGLSEKTQLKNGLPPIWKNNLILFTNVDGFHISGISCRNQRWWALNFVYCCNGTLTNIDFCACDIGIDENGQAYRGLKRNKYEEILVKNADGIDLRQGCHHISVDEITGFCEDDSVAITGLPGRLEKSFTVEGLSGDIHDITVKNVCTTSFWANVRLLNQGGVRLYNVLVDGVNDTSENSPHLDKSGYGVRVGDARLYGSRHATAEETANITIRNVNSRGKYAVSLAGAMSNLTLENIEGIGGTPVLEDLRNQ